MNGILTNPQDRRFGVILCPDAWEENEDTILNADANLIRKVNPHTGITVQADFYAGELSKARTNQDYRREVMTKLFNVFQSERVVSWLQPRDIRPLQIDARIDWPTLLPHLREKFGGEEVTVLLRLHPNLIGKVNTSSLQNSPAVIDMTRYHDMQELLCISDMLITDYSSSMFDYAMLRRPCLLFATDVEQYDRGYYYDFSELPIPLARNGEQLANIIRDFDLESYLSTLDRFLNETLGLKERGVAAKELAEWMRNRMI